jgi:hypothetical protein
MKAHRDKCGADREIFVDFCKVESTARPSLQFGTSVAVSRVSRGVHTILMRASLDLDLKT